MYSSAGSKISGSDLYIKVSANKKRVHEQEPILLTYKVYTLVALTQLEGKMPELSKYELHSCIDTVLRLFIKHIICK